MDLESVILSEVSQTKKVEYHVTSLVCGIYLKRNDTSELKHKTETDSGFENELLVSEGKG